MPCTDIWESLGGILGKNIFYSSHQPMVALKLASHPLEQNFLQSTLPVKFYICFPQYCMYQELIGDICMSFMEEILLLRCSGKFVTLSFITDSDTLDVTWTALLSFSFAGFVPFFMRDCHDITGGR